jgi:hypothetical protein
MKLGSAGLERRHFPHASAAYCARRHTSASLLCIYSDALLMISTDNPAEKW